MNLTVQTPDAFLALQDKSNDSLVTQLALNDQELSYFPCNLGKLFPNLKKLRSTTSNVKEIKRMNFKDMQHLQYLDLSHNLLTSLQSDVFVDLKNLEELDFYNNTLTSLHRNIFSHNLELTKIYGSFNKIESLEAGIFRKNEKLTEIYFDNNLLAKVNFRFDTRFSSLYFDLINNICIDKAFKLTDAQSFIDVNSHLERNC